MAGFPVATGPSSWSFESFVVEEEMQAPPSPVVQHPDHKTGVTMWIQSKRVYADPPAGCEARLAQALRISRRARHPDSNLGRFEPGPSPQQMTYGSSKNLVREMAAAADGPMGTPFSDGSAVFMDLGCGHGLVSMVAVAYGARRAVGIDLDRFKVGWGQANISSAPEFSGVELRCDDIVQWDWDTDVPTFIFSFDVDFPPTVKMAILCQLASNVEGWRVWATAKPLRWWREMVAEYLYNQTAQREVLLDFLGSDRYLELAGVVNVTLSGSSERHRIYIYRNRGYVYM